MKKERNSADYSPPHPRRVQKPMADRLAFFISGLSSPFVVITGFALWVIAYYSPSLQQCILLSFPFVLLIIALPFVWIYTGVRRGRFTDIHVMLREQRAEPFVVATIGAIILTGIYSAIRAPHPIIVMAANLVVNGLLFGVLTQYWKASMHAASFAAGVLIAAIMIDTRLAVLGALLPLIVWARIRRKRHSVAQTVGAVVIACVSTVLVCKVLGLG